MTPAMPGNLILIFSLAVLFTALYYLIEKVSRRIENCSCGQEALSSEDTASSEKRSAEDIHEVGHAARKSRGCKGSGGG